ncbi:penicillin acylase family protein [Marivirga salinae]|uniref:Penicillin acylase family protein n=1 Tax=Marivirga salinarum TaxID=3059078 RepID=A0AA51RE87_9BACT|nr:penicillin acylase family protein [Marivirga sp. BDSF4-3]WMN11999.1 penicillin acylase family protein [Marivirga sp. BDSF4-3]
MNKKINYILFSFILCLSFACNTTDSTPSTAEKLAQEVTIYRDIYGIPHVKGETDESTIFGFAYARAEDQFHKIELKFIQSIGRLAEIEGEAGKSNDVRIKAFEIERLSKEEYKSLDPKIKKLCDAYAMGINYYLENNPEVSPRLLTHFEPWFILAEYKNNAFAGLGQVRVNDDMIVEYLMDDIKSIGSNAFALGKGKTKSNNAILVTNPHLNYNEAYEVQLTSEEGLNFYGVVGYGAGIIPVMGHNENLGWAWTVNRPDVADTYEIQFDHPEDSSLYSFGEEYLEVESYQDSMKIKTDSGFTYQKITFRKTIHGPILSESESGKPLSIKLAGLEKGGMLNQLYQMALSENLESFKDALRLNSLSVHNITYADDQGNIFYLYNGIIPKRDTSLNWQRPVDGSLKKSQWQGYHSLEELPQLLNPDCGYIQNCNNDPFETTTNENPNPDDYPDYMKYYEINTNRGRRARVMLDSMQNATIASLESAKFDTYIQNADENLQALMKEVIEVNREDPERIAKIEEPLKLLQSWDKYSSSESVETSLFYIWTFKRFHQRRIGTKFYNLVAFEEAIEKLENEKGSWKVKWGDIYRHQRTLDPEQYSFDSLETSYPISGGISITGIMFASSGDFEGHLPDVGLKGLNIRAHSGDSYVSIVEFGEQVKAKSIIPYGVSDHPESDHYDDQAELYAQGKLKPVFFTQDEILENLKAEYRPGEMKWR